MISLRTAMSLLAAVSLSFLLISGNVVWAGEATAKAAPAVDEQVKESTDQQTAEKRKQILEEATGAIRETQNALQALDKEDGEAALAALERAAGKLEIILAREPELALAPAGVNTVTYDVLASIEAIERVRESAEDALADGRLQEARRLIDDLASETVISVTNVPLATYPDAIRLSVGLIDKGDLDAAADVLQTALNTLVVTDAIIPLPVAAARQLLRDAQELAAKEDRSEDEVEQLKEHLQAARHELEFADALGYGSERDFASLYEQLDNLEDRVDQGDSGKGFFAKVQELLNDTIESSQPDANERT